MQLKCDYFYQGVITRVNIFRLVLRDAKPTTYSSTIQQLYEQARKNVQMFVTLLPTNSAEVYNAIKRKCYCELGGKSNN